MIDLYVSKLSLIHILMEAEADLERVLVIDDRDTPLTLADERIRCV